jgi:hypothetical protein
VNVIKDQLGGWRLALIEWVLVIGGGLLNCSEPRLDGRKLITFVHVLLLEEVIVAVAVGVLLGSFSKLIGSG